MRNIIYNNAVVAIPPHESNEATTSPTDKPFEMFGSEYGLWFPITTSGYQFLRWLRRGMKPGELPEEGVLTYMLHVSNDGEVLAVYADARDNLITMVPWNSDKFALMNADHDLTEAYTSALEDTKTIGDAVQFIEEHLPHGMYQPRIIFVEEWVKYAQEKGYDKVFLNNTFR